MHRLAPKRSSIIIVLALLLCVPTPALSVPEDRDQPIQLEAERAELDQRTGTSIYYGNVVITQGSMRLVADKATIYTDGGSFERMEAVGNPVRWRYKPAADKDELYGTSQQIEYNAVDNLIVMTNNAKVTQNKDVFTGDWIEYDLSSDLVKARGREGQRIQMTIQPKQQQ